MKILKKTVQTILSAVFMLTVGWLCMGSNVSAAEDVIRDGIYADDIALSGMTQEEACEVIEEYVDSLSDAQITLVTAGGHEVTVTAREFDICWGNPELVDEAVSFGSVGNVIERYKALKDLEHEDKVYDIYIDFGLSSISNVLSINCAQYDQKAENATMTRSGSSFVITPEQVGYKLDVESSIDIVYDSLTNGWRGEPIRIELAVEVDTPKTTSEDLAEVTDVLGTFTTSYSSSGTARSANVANGCSCINGSVVYPGEEFSTYDAVKPFTEENGYYMAGSYLNGQVVDSIGGGICQVSTTLYNAVLRAELEVTERHNHSMIVTYVDPSADAAIAESSGKDFKFINNTDYPIYIEGSTYNKTITFTIYGKETRDSNRKVEYVSEVLETTYPESDTIYQDPGQPIGYYVSGDSAHIGYKARLWKVVTVDGVEVSREQVNSSTYKMTPRSATVGTATDDEEAYNTLQAAIATGSLDQVRSVINSLTAGEVQGENTEVIENETPAESTETVENEAASGSTEIVENEAPAGD